MMNATDAVAAMRFLQHEANEHDGEARRVLVDTANYLGQQATNGVPTGVEAEVCALIAQRQRAGIAKYGMSVADNPLALRDWLQHALEEALDQAIYLKRAIDELDGQKIMFVLSTDEIGDTLSLATARGQSIADLQVSPMERMLVMKVSS
jgi:hypothetical protein